MFRGKLYEIATTNIFSIAFLPFFIVEQGIFPLQLLHHISVNDIRSDGHPFFTLHFSGVHEISSTVNLIE